MNDSNGRGRRPGTTVKATEASASTLKRRRQDSCEKMSVKDSLYYAKKKMNSDNNPNGAK